MTLSFFMSSNVVGQINCGYNFNLKCPQKNYPQNCVAFWLKKKNGSGEVVFEMSSNGATFVSLKSSFDCSCLYFLRNNHSGWYINDFYEITCRIYFYSPALHVISSYKRGFDSYFTVCFYATCRLSPFLLDTV